ncbi:uncharacterized protein LOC110116068 [Dendrobium catenatum]|uniref:uncharacterized protein LOC110116068 n=1 Tax=Dendrobium catenatum TaxID=906689 RepID=UPI0009F16273|nr:uncharacterized protein LOC110116068 [Dendrobium catenatum]
MEEVLSGGPWYIGGHIVGLDRWSPSFSPLSLKGLTAPVWIRFPLLSLHCWDEVNIAKIASRVGTPMFLDGNSLNWSKKEFARVCVRVDLESKLPSRIWVDGIGGRFFQKVEYEKLSSFCFHCARIGHLKADFSDLVFKSAEHNEDLNDKANQSISHNNVQENYGPWIHIKFKKRSNFKANQMGQNFKEKQFITRNNIPDNIKDPTVINTLHINNDKTLKVNSSADNICLSNSFNVLVGKELNQIADNVADIPDPVGIIDKPASLDEMGDLSSLVLKASQVSPHKHVTHVDAEDNPIVLSSELKTSKIHLNLVPKNCRGVKKKETALYLKEIVKDNAVFFIGLAETKLSLIDRKMAVGLAGGILVLWRNSLVSFTVTAHSSQVVFGVLKTPMNVNWNVATVYGNKELQVHRDLWRILEQLMTEELPIIVGGDFNCLLSRADKRGGNRFCLSKGIKEMRLFMANQDLHDLNVVGPRYTWCNNKQGNARILERLDHFLLNSAALLLVPTATVKHLARVSSDQCPLVFKIDDKQHTKAKNFRFEHTWKSYPATRKIVADAWGRHDFGEEADILNRKIKRTLKSLFFWNKNKCKKLDLLKEDLKNDILNLQLLEEAEGGLSTENLALLRGKVKELNTTLLRLSMWWNQHAKAVWNEEGDNNSRFYHTYASARKNGNMIQQIKDINNVMVDDEDLIE